MSSEFILPKGETRDDVLARLLRFLHQVPETKAWRITVKPYRSSRTTAQNAYLHGVAYRLLSEATGYELADIGEFCCGKHFGWQDKRVPKTPRNPGGVVSVPVRTTTRDETGKRDVLDWAAFSDYVAFVQRFGANHGVYIPDPDPYWRSNAEEAA